MSPSWKVLSLIPLIRIPYSQWILMVEFQSPCIYKAYILKQIFSHVLCHIYLSMHVSGKIPAKQLSNHKWSGREVQSSCFWKWLNSFLSPSSDFKHWDVFWTLRKRKLCKITYTCITCTTMWYVVYIRYQQVSFGLPSFLLQCFNLPL